MSIKNFAYYAHLNLRVFMLAGARALLIALATMSFQTIRSAAVNPIIGLRNE
jgi:putative ABC transport system permease protein